MDATAVHQRLQSKFGDKVVEVVTDNPDPFIIIDKTSVKDVCAFLKTESDLEFNYLQSISGVDTTEELHLVYHLFSYTHRHSIVIKMKLPYDETTLSSVTSVWEAADWHEREQFDLFGFNFEGHPDLRRLLLPEDWVGHPLLKSYEYPEEYHNIDHHRDDPLAQFHALDGLVAKAKEAKEQEKTNE